MWLYVAVVAVMVCFAKVDGATCVCFTTTTNVRDAACGTKLQLAHNDECYLATGLSASCTLSGSSYVFRQIQLGSQKGWAASNFMTDSSSDKCNSCQDTELCFTGSSVNIRNAACGSTILGTGNTGDCYPATGKTSTCTLGSSQYHFKEFDFNGQTGWAAGNYLSESNTDCDACGNVEVKTRADWGASPSQNALVKIPQTDKIYIHHSAGASCTSFTSCKSQVKAIQNYHMNTKGWSDIGYSFLVGEDGNVYEGRGWGHQGAHTSGCNSQGHGICIMGTYTSALPNTAALNAVKNLIKCGISKGYVKENYILRGHRDVKSTECPGLTLYNEIKTWDNYSSTLDDGC